MCRFIGIVAQQPVSAATALLHSPNSLLVQSRGRKGCGPHADGWGIGYYERQMPQVQRSPSPAYADDAFRDTAKRVRSHAIVAHVRQKSVGECSPANTHPFVCGRWLFAHNGTVTAFDQVAPSLETETRREHLRLRQGATDSELVFLWLLSRLRAADIDLAASTDVAGVSRVLRDSVRLLAARCPKLHPEEPRLNFLLTDGQTLWATRWNQTLCWLQSMEGAGGTTASAISIASEPTGPEPWNIVPNYSLLCAVAAHGMKIESLGFAPEN